MEQAKINLIINRQDDEGNRLAYDERTGAVSIQQSNEKERWRPIGKITVEDNLTIYEKFEKESDKYKKFKAWSVYYILLDIVDAIRYETESFVYYINKVELYRHGFTTKDKGHGYGRKIVCPIKHWTIFPKNKASKKLLNTLGYEWFDELKEYFKTDQMRSLGAFIKKERSSGIITPKSEDVFRPFRECGYIDTKVILMDIAPFEDGLADGLAFSNRQDSLTQHRVNKYLLDWIEQEQYDGFNLNSNQDLTRLAHQGVLLLNSIYTANFFGRESHKNKGWEEFNKHIIKTLFLDPLHKPVVLILLGDTLIEEYFDFALSLTKNKHTILTAHYPKETGSNDNVFEKCNSFLTLNRIDPIQW